jgi:hypothetical protein
MSDLDMSQAPGERTMSVDMFAVLDGEVPKTAPEAPSKPAVWVETALTVLFTASAVLFVSFVAVVTGIV